ncbi:phosphohydrolase [Caryophanon tenue]|uniref:Phosphohydrolase n=2 Tax=Caryophanon tenue TaxID=33978 RepID=A0A1C0YEP4_9BACL|nr:HD domain-containing protein [Caryophanon tenue]OCS85656.1 phosphohydrolase [Caryophanon tenue]
MVMVEIAGIKIPDTKMALDAKEVLLENGSDLLFNHSNRVYLFGALKAQKEQVKYDQELLYISALFHDLGLTKLYSSDDLRFEVDGANAARQFLQTYNVEKQAIQVVWDAIALHTTPGIAEHKENEVALLFAGVGTDVMGDGYELLTETERQAVLDVFPRVNFKQNIIQAFYDGIKHKPQTTFGNMKQDICAHFNPQFKNKNFCDCILHSPWKE